MSTLPKPPFLSLQIMIFHPDPCYLSSAHLLFPNFPSNFFFGFSSSPLFPFAFEPVSSRLPFGGGEGVGLYLFLLAGGGDLDGE